jgi:hypothetical protein
MRLDTAIVDILADSPGQFLTAPPLLGQLGGEAELLDI